MIKFPLHKPIILITKLGELKCKVIYGGKDTIKVIEVQRKRYIETDTEDEFEYTFDDPFEGIMIIDRDKVLGYVNVPKLARKKYLKKKNVIDFNEKRLKRELNLC
jgi:hypothetical protein